MRHDIFPTPVWHIEGAPLKLIDELYQGAYKFKEVYTDNQNRSSTGGYQTPPLEWDKFHPQGREYIEKVVSECDGHLFKSFEGVNWWFNINGQGHWNTPHSHPGSDYALVFYLTDSDSLLQFMSPHHMRQKQPSLRSINAKKGDILIFPSDIMHFVMPNPREEDRVSISVNLRLCGN